MKEFIDLLRSSFCEKLKGKTSWGEYEIILLFERCVAESLADWVDRRGQC